MLKKILFVLLFLVAIYLVLCAMGDKRTNIKITKNIPSTPQLLFPYISEFKKMSIWSPWEGKDPNIKRSYSGPETGVGAKFEWASNIKEVGHGSQETIEYIINQKVVNKLEFKDFNSKSMASISLVPNASGTDVIWSMDDLQDMPFMLRGMMKLIGMKGMVEKDFSTGLNNLTDLMAKTSAINTNIKDSSQTNILKK